MSGEIEPTIEERQAFGRWFLQDILDWVAENIDPDQVWTADELIKFIYNNNDLYKAMIELVADTELPGDVFTEDALYGWAFDKGLE